MKTIKDMPKHSRPHEQLQEKGASARTGTGFRSALRRELGTDTIFGAKN